MNKRLKEPILKLHNEGKTAKEIRNILNCSYSTISYYLSPTTKEMVRKKSERQILSGKRTEYNKTYLKKNKNALKSKYVQFGRLGTGRNRIFLQPSFSFDELVQYTDNNPVCYLTGKNIDITESSTYSLDHKIPSSRGGENSLENLGVCRKEINIMKNDKTPEELIQLCKEILIYQGYKITKN